MTTSWVARAWTRAAVLSRSQNRVSIETIQAPVTVMPAGVVPAAGAGPGLGVTRLRVPVTLAGPAARESPMPRLAVTALASRRTVLTPALTRGRVTQATDRSLRVAVTAVAAIGSEAICPWCTLVAAASDHVGFALALPTNLLTDCTERALEVTLTGHCPVMQDS